MRVWPQVPLGGRSPSTPMRRLPTPAQVGPPEHCKKMESVGRGKEGGEGRAVAGRQSPPVVGNGPNTVLGSTLSTVSNTKQSELSEFFGAH